MGTEELQDGEVGEAIPGMIEVLIEVSKEED